MTHTGKLRLLSTAAVALTALATLSGCGRADSHGTAAATTASAPAPTTGASAAHPVVVELFQSQGCSSCPPANAAVNAIVDRPDVLALSFSVTYWDQLGWKDSFATPAYTARQWDYARVAGRPQVATPQVIVNGGPTIVGSNPAGRRADREAGPGARRSRDRGGRWPDPAVGRAEGRGLAGPL